jgi:undecaprenyl diphosphate synthase
MGLLAVAFSHAESLPVYTKQIDLGGSRLAEQVQRGELDPANIDEATIANNLYTAGMADPDLLIRTAGEMRISNYLLWQISYAELWVTPRCWPDFSGADLRDAIQNYAARTRRYGGLPT